MKVYKALEVNHVGRNSIIFKNFSGIKTLYNEEGHRNFCICLDDPDAKHYKYDGVKYDVGRSEDDMNNLIRAMQDDGWNVKWTKGSEDYPSHPYIRVNISLERTLPNGRKISGPKMVLVSEEGSLTEIPEEIKETFLPKFDRQIIEYADMVINPYNYDPATNAQSAYLNVMYTKFMNTDPFAKDYENGSNRDMGDY